MVVVEDAGRRAAQRLDGGGETALELVVVVGIEDIVLAVVLVLDDGIGRSEASFQQFARALPFHAAPVRVGGPFQEGGGEVLPLRPDSLVDQGLKPCPVSSRLGPEDAKRGGLPGLCL